METPKVLWPKVVLFGDSLIQRSLDPDDGRWGALLGDQLQRVADVVFRGFSGYNTRMCRVLLPSLFHAEDVHDIHAFVICLGANDSNSEKSPTKQHVPITEFKSNYSCMINYLLSIGVSAEKIVIMTPPPYHYESHAAYCESVGNPAPLKDNQTVKQYAEECKKVGAEHLVEVLDLYSEMMKEENWPSHLIDGLHFSRSGSHKVFSLLWPSIEKRTNSKKQIFPVWSDVDPQNTESILSNV